MDVYHGCRPPTAPRTGALHRWLSFEDYHTFVRDHLWFHRSNPNVLSRQDISQIFVAVKLGGGKGVKPLYINFGEFRSAIVLLALAGSVSTLASNPVVHVNVESNSSALSMVAHGGMLQHRRDFEPTPLDRLLWLFRRIYTSEKVTVHKAPYLTTFRRAFARQLEHDKDPTSYLMPRGHPQRRPQRENILLPPELLQRETSSSEISIGSETSEWIKLRAENGTQYYYNQIKNVVPVTI